MIYDTMSHLSFFHLFPCQFYLLEHALVNQSPWMGLAKRRLLIKAILAGRGF